MSDQKGSDSDRQGALSGRDSGRFAASSDRAWAISDRPFRWVRVLPLLAVIGCAHPPPAPPPPAVAPKAIWVDVMGPGGDGSPEHPAKDLAAVLAPGLELHLRSGLYRGPFTLPAGVKLVGEGQAVLFAEGGEATVVTAPEGAQLTRLSVQGGGVGLTGAGKLDLDQVHFSGHRRAALVMNRGELHASGLEVEATVPVTPGFVLDATPEATGPVPLPPRGFPVLAVVRSTRFFGPFHHALDLRGGGLELRDVTFEGAEDPLRVRDAVASLIRVAARGGRGAAVFASHAQLEVRELEVLGHEYALDARETNVALDGAKVKLTEHAGLALVKCTGVLHGLHLERPGSFAGLQLLGSNLEIEELEVVEADAAAVVVRQGEVKLSGLRIHGVRAEKDAGRGESGGDALMLRDCKCSVHGAEVEDAQGAGAWVSAAAVADLNGLTCRRCELGALVVELASKVTARHVTAQGAHGPAISVLEHAQLEVSGLEVSQAQVPIWAECEKGAAVRASGLAGQEQPGSPCIALKP